MRMTFLGAAGTVTGSKNLLEHNDPLLADCSLTMCLPHSARNASPI
jgi:hypothetical protein